MKLVATMVVVVAVLMMMTVMIAGDGNENCYEDSCDDDGFDERACQRRRRHL